MENRFWARSLTAVAALAALAGCSSYTSTTSSSSSTESFVPTAAVPGGGGFKGEAPPTGAQSTIELSADNAVVWGSAAAVIDDTSKYPRQIQVAGPWEGPVRVVRDGTPPHGKAPSRPIGSPNGLPVGTVDESLAPVNPGTLFPALDQTPWTPPDPTLAVGPNHIVATVNMDIAWYNKAGVQQFRSRLDNTGSPGFFESVGCGNFTFDPKCFYDHYAGRFVVIAPEVYGSTEAWLCIAVSDDSDPNGTWFKYRTNAVVTVGAQTFWVDYPGFGYDQQAYYVTGNLFGLNSGGFGGVFYRVFNKTPLLSGGAAVFTTLRDGSGASCQVAQHFGTNQAAYFVEVASSSSLKVSAIRNPITAPTRVSTTVTVPAFSSAPGGANIGGSISTIDDRLFNVGWRNGNLYTTHHIGVGGRAAARWYHLNTNNWPTSGGVSLVQSGNITSGTLATYFPAIYSNRCDSVGIVVGASTSSTAPSVRVAGRKATDAAGTFGPLTTLITGPNGVSGRWGDYFDIAVDPTDDTTFWVIGEYQTGSGWANWIGSFGLGGAADYNGDGFVSGDDFDAYVADFESGDIQADFNHDGFLSGDDFDAFVAAFNSGC